MVVSSAIFPSLFTGHGRTLDKILFTYLQPRIDFVGSTHSSKETQMPTEVQVKIAMLEAIVKHNQSTFERYAEGEITFERYSAMAFPIGASSILEDAISKLFQEKQNAR
jgi:hypothetical protein